jgi:hypothetical protein
VSTPSNVVLSNFLIDELRELLGVVDLITTGLLFLVPYFAAELLLNEHFEPKEYLGGV